MRWTVDGLKPEQMTRPYILALLFGAALESAYPDLSFKDRVYIDSRIGVWGRLFAPLVEIRDANELLGFARWGARTGKHHIRRLNPSLGNEPGLYFARNWELIERHYQAYQAAIRKASPAEKAVGDNGEAEVEMGRRPSTTGTGGSRRECRRLAASGRHRPLDASYPDPSSAATLPMASSLHGMRWRRTIRWLSIYHTTGRALRSRSGASNMGTTSC